MKTIKVTRTYLQLINKPALDFDFPDKSVKILPVKNPTVDFYLYLYNAVGADINWVDRNLLPKDDLEKMICSPQVIIFVMYYQGHPAGYTELCRENGDSIELAYFGLLPKYRGKGLGKYLLNFTIEKAFQYYPRRLWLHTCNLDHPHALQNYIRRGFQVFDQKIVDQRVK
ncbi:MAG: GNAT family N-acetyltransferase [Cyclobacteriaceae bacterium]